MYSFSFCSILCPISASGFLQKFLCRETSILVNIIATTEVGYQVNSWKYNVDAPMWWSTIVWRCSYHK